MGKSKTKERKGHSNHQDDPKSRKRGIVKRDYSQPTPKARSADASKHHQASQKNPKIPFSKRDRVLLVGEGDFSFTRSLIQHHNVKHVVATSYDSEIELQMKYPEVTRTLEQIKGRVSPTVIRFNTNSRGSEDEDQEEWNGFSSPDSSTSDESFEDGDFVFREDVEKSMKDPTQPCATVHFGINAAKLSTSHKKVFLSGGPFSKVVFNFPHVGGLSTDVNRQVRSNQELLVGFFNSAKALLATETSPIFTENTTDEQDEVDFDLETGEPLVDAASPQKGQILVTLFEGEPYTLWNIRDLARHCNLKVVESFKFPWSAYPGYKHARTIGEVSGKEREGKRSGAWRGEERDARMYVLEVKDDESLSQGPAQVGGTGGNETVLGKRRKKGAVSEEDSDGSDCSY